MNKLRAKIDRLGTFLSYKELRLRKWTTPIHWLFGFLCDFLIYTFGILAGWGMMGIFGWWEKWNDYCDGTKQGSADWWESFLTFCIGQVVLALLSQKCLGIIVIGWY